MLRVSTPRLVYSRLIVRVFSAGKTYWEQDVGENARHRRFLLDVRGRSGQLVDRNGGHQRGTVDINDRATRRFSGLGRCHVGSPVLRQVSFGDRVHGDL